MHLYCSGALHTLAAGHRMSISGGFGPCCSWTASGVGKSVNREVRRDTPQLSQTPLPPGPQLTGTSSPQPHRSHFGNLQGTRDSSPQGEGWQSALDLSCSACAPLDSGVPALTALLWCVSLKDCLPVSRLLQHEDWLVCLSLRVFLRWL